jgi:hypothetical protein
MHLATPTDEGSGDAVQLCGSPVAVLQADANPRYGRQTGATGSVAAFPAEFRRRMQFRSVLKGQIISLIMGENGPSAAGVTFHASLSWRPPKSFCPRDCCKKGGGWTTHSASPNTGRRSVNAGST